MTKAPDDLLKAIRASSDRFEAHFKAGDAAALVEDYYVADDLGPMLSAPDMPILRGHDAITGMFKALMEGVAEIRLEQVEVMADQTLAQELGRAIITDRQGDNQIARYAILWRNTDQGWRVQTDFFAPGDLV